MYSVDNEVVNDLRRHTRDYVNNIGGLLIIPELTRREYKKKDRLVLEDSVLVGDLEELVEKTLQEVVPNLQPTLSLPIHDCLSSCILFWVNQG